MPPANYNYIRSSEDISSGYSSAEPVSAGLSRTSSMTNATRPRFKGKRAEDQNYLDTVQYDASDEVPPLMYPPQYPFFPLSSSTPLHPFYQNFDTLEHLKDESFFDNEAYFQEQQAVKESRKTDQGRPMKLSEMDEKQEMPDEMQDKYALFCKWLEENEKMHEKTVGITRDTIQKQSSEDDFQDTISIGSDPDEFTDVIADISIESSKLRSRLCSQKPDAFAKVVVLNSENSSSENSINKVVDVEDTKYTSTENDPKKENTAERHQATETLAQEEGAEQTNDRHIKETASTFQDPSHVVPKLESLLENLQKQAQSTLSEMNSVSTTVPSVSEMNLEKKESLQAKLLESDVSKRPASHTKGKAPEPPGTSPISISHQEYVQISSASPQPSASLQSLDYLQTIDPCKSSDVSKPHSRSPSPKPEGKKSKKGLFKSYLPSLFRSESPKPTTQPPSEDYHKETQI